MTNSIYPQQHTVRASQSAEVIPSGDTKQRNRLDIVEKNILKTMKDVETNFYYAEMKPIIIMNLVLARHPYKIDSNGDITVKLYSWQTMYCFVVYFIQAVISILTYKEIVIKRFANESNISITSESTPAYDNTLYSVLLLNFLHFQLFVPVGDWLVTKDYIEFLNKWRTFQEMYKNTTKTNIVLNYNKIITILSVFIYISTLFMDIIESKYLLSDLYWLFVLPFILITIDIMFLTMSWGFTMLIIGSLAEELGNHFYQVLQSVTTSKTIHAYHRLWLELSNLLESYCSLMCYKFVGFLSAITVCFVVGAYGLAMSITDKEGFEKFVAFIIPVLFALVLLLVFCDLSHRTTQKVGINFVTKIYKCNFLRFSEEERYELKLLLNTISSKPPDVRIGDFFVVNRGFFKTIVSGIMTYLIILVQFKISSSRD